jgi:hypothetical protein
MQGPLRLTVASALHVMIAAPVIHAVLDRVNTLLIRNVLSIRISLDARVIQRMARAKVEVIILQS